MITAADVRACRDLAGLVALVAKLGWSPAPVPVDPARWETIGVDPALAERVRLARAATAGAVEIFVGEGPASAADLSRFSLHLASWNTVTKFVFLYRNTASGGLAVYGTDPQRRVRRIDLDPDRPRADAVERLRGLDRHGRAAPEVAAAIEKALEKEAIGRRFFGRFREDARRLTAELLALHPREPRDAAAGEALRILSRILFLYFVQQKRWLDGSPSFLPDLVDRSRRVREGLFTGVFLPLFFGVLNTPVRERDPFALRFGRIPYLNGGLFEPSDYERRHPVIPLDDATLESIVFDTFERFQFAVEEDDEIGAHVDPEMLGRVFENLMAEDERLVSGSFYTPRPVVNALVRRALVAWCAGPDPRVRRALEAWTAGEAAALGRLDARALLDRVLAIRVLDPACGSGAFLLSALQWLERLEGALRTRCDSPATGSIRRRIVADALFGIDLKPEAVRLCELRLWLAVVAPHEGEPMTIEPLPNLDRNILQGNALLGPLDWAGGARIDLYREWSFALRAREQLAARYRRARSSERLTLSRALRASDRELAAGFLDRSIASAREEIEDLSRRQAPLFATSARNRERILTAERRIGSWKEMRAKIVKGEIDFFAPEVHFDHVLSEGGFSLVVGNPPWVRMARIPPETRRALADRYALFRPGKSRVIPQSDLSLAFFEKSVDLAAPGGVVALLMPAKVATADYAAAFRRFIHREVDLVSVEDWSEEGKRLFEADTFPLGLVARRAAPGPWVDVAAGSESIRLPQRKLSRNPGGPWILVPIDVRRVIGRLERDHPSFAATFGRPLMGVKSGANADFFVDPEIDWPRGVARISGIEVPIAALVRVVRGRDVKRWIAADARWMLWPDPGAPWLARLFGKTGSPRKLAYARREHRLPKVVWKDVSRGVAAAALEPERLLRGRKVPVVPNQTLYCAPVPKEEHALLAAAVLNSTVAGAILVASADRAKDFHYRYFGRTVAALPVPDFDPTSQRRVVELARRAARGEKVDAEIDRLVTRAYAVDPDDLARLSDLLEKRLGRSRPAGDEAETLFA